MCVVAAWPSQPGAVQGVVGRRIGLLAVWQDGAGRRGGRVGFGAT